MPYQSEFKHEHSALKRFFINARESGSLSIVNITSLVYIVVLSLTFIDYYIIIPLWVIAIQAVGVVVILANIVYLRTSKNIPLAATVMLFCMFIIHMVNVTFAGGLDTVHYAWIFIFPVLAGGTMGWRGQLFFWLICIIGTVYYYYYPVDAATLSYDNSLNYTLVTRLMCITVFSLVMLTYHFTLSQKMDYLQQALDLASFESELFSGVFNSQAQAVILIDQRNRIVRANNKANSIFFKTNESMIDQSIASLCIEAELLFSSDNANSKPKEAKLELVDASKQSNHVWVEYTQHIIKRGSSSYYQLLIVEDISTRKAHESNLSHLAHYDYLTQLPNRLMVTNALSSMIEAADPNKDKFAVIFIDLDKFKEINDVQGHKAGDTVLIEIANRLRAVMGQQDHIGRFGGDEFILLLQNAEDQTAVINLINTVQDTIAQGIELNDAEYYVGSSVGVAMYPTDGHDHDDLVRKSDTAMYKAKENRGSFEFFNADYDHKIARQVRLSRDLFKAVANNELYLVFQPVFDRHNSMIGVEALLRWSHQALGNITPDEFIPICEDNGSIVPVGMWVIEESFKTLKQWHKQGHGHLTMSVNVSYKQMLSGHLVDDVKAQLILNELAGDKVVLELTERVFAEDIDLVYNTVSQLAELGIKTAIDDFGIGFSSLSYLEKIPFSLLKIDKSFVDDIDTSESSNKLCKAIVSMATSLNLTVTAEGIERSVQQDSLLKMKVDHFQGYLFSKPIDADSVLAMLSRQAPKPNERT